MGLWFKNSTANFFLLSNKHDKTQPLAKLNKLLCVEFRATLNFHIKGGSEFYLQNVSKLCQKLQIIIHQKLTSGIFLEPPFQFKFPFFTRNSQTVAVSTHKAIQAKLQLWKASARSSLGARHTSLLHFLSWLSCFLFLSLR